MGYYSDEAVDRAADYYHRWHEEQGNTVDMPSRQDSERVGDMVYLRSGGRLLAQFRLGRKGSLHWLGRSAQLCQA